MSDDPTPPETGFDTIRITKADGCVWEYQVRDLKLEFIGVPEGHRVAGEPIGELELTAGRVFGSAACDRDPRPPAPFDHVTLKVADLAASRAFYLAALGPLGFEAKVEFPGVAGLGATGPCLWLAQEPDAATANLHACFRADDRAQVDAFHAAALVAGAACNGPPGLRAQYHPGYYAAFVIDPDGNNLEVVFHGPPAAAGGDL